MQLSVSNASVLVFCLFGFFVTIHFSAVIAEDIIRSTSTLTLQSSVIYPYKSANRS